jgi:hypothetical protein
MAVGDVFRVVITASAATHFYQNTYAVRMEVEPAPDASMFAAFAGDAVTLFANGQNQSCIYQSWSATQLWGTGMSIVASECRREGGLQFADVFTGRTGAQIVDALPPQCSLVLTINTGQTGKRKRGRIYAFNQLESNQVEGVWNGAFMTSQTAAANTFFNLYKHPTGTNPNLTLGVWSERTASGCVPALPPAKGHIPRDAPHPEQAFTPATSFTLRPIVYTQRRRTRGVGF